MNIDVPAGVGNMPLDTQLQYRANLEAKSPKLFIRLKVLSKQIFNVRNLEKPGYSTVENNLECCDSNFWDVSFSQHASNTLCSFSGSSSPWRGLVKVYNSIDSELR